MTDARLLVTALRDPGSVARLDAERWTALIAIARAESLLGSLAHRIAEQDLAPRVVAIIADARTDAAQAQRHALWEAEMARHVLAPLGLAPILLKGTAYAAAGLDAAIGRSIGDLDILVPRDRLDEAERALLGAGWEWVKEDAYDDLYYRRWMHELPPLIHRERDRMIDVHHTILPLTHRRRPDAPALIADSVALPSGLRVLAPADMVIHAAAHLVADGDLAGGLRNLWDIDRLLRHFSSQEYGFVLHLVEQAHAHGLGSEVMRALRLSQQVYATPMKGYAAPAEIRLEPRAGDSFFVRRLLARNGWGQPSRPITRQAFYLRSHWLRMPPFLLARHLWTKARK